MSTPTFPVFASGTEAAEEEAKEIGGGGAEFRKTHYLPRMESGDTIFLRYLSDAPWTYAAFHNFVLTKGQPADYPSERTWPKSMSATCRYTKALAGFYQDCFICDNKLTDERGKFASPKVRQNALAVLREPVIGTQEMADAGQITPEMIGRRVGFTDATREVQVPVLDAEGNEVRNAEGKLVTETKTEIAIILIQQAMKNYFAGLQACYNAFGTVCDRDYALTRKGEGVETDYSHVPLDPIPSLKPGMPGWKRYEDAIADQGATVDINQVLFSKTTDEHYHRYFDTRYAAPEYKGGKPTGGGQASVQQAAPAAPAADEGLLAELRARMRGEAPAQAQAPTPATDTAQAPVAAQGPLDFTS